MTMSRDRVRFFLSRRYTKIGGMDRVVHRAFGMSSQKFYDLRDRSGGFRSCGPSTDTRDGFWVTCRPSQFTRFMVYRAELLASGSYSGTACNGFRDLHVTLFTPEESRDTVVEVDVSGQAHERS